MKILVAGGGPAGLAAAIFARQGGAEVVVLEKNAAPGVKLLATGGGRANVTNRRPLAEWPALFGRRGRFIAPALAALDAEGLGRWLEDLGVPLACPDGFHLFPAADSAKVLRNALSRRAAELGVHFATRRTVAAVVPAAGGFTLSGDDWAGTGDAVILATGGNSYPSTGSTWDGVRLAAALGHRTTPPLPGLVGLRAANLDAGLAGLVLPDATVRFAGKGRETVTGRGELLLTHHGVSGPAVLDMSATLAEALAAAHDATIHIQWLADGGADWWRSQFSRWRRESGALQLAACLKEFMPYRLAAWLLARAEAGKEVRAAEVTGAERDSLIRLLAGYPAEITGTEGWGKAMITRGGVDVREVDPRTLESRIVPGLYFAGEMLGVDGPCGGYNLHWALAGGALAGMSASQRG